MYKDMSGLETKDTLQTFVDKNNGRLPVEPIPDTKKYYYPENKALKVFK